MSRLQTVHSAFDRDERNVTVTVHLSVCLWVCLFVLQVLDRFGYRKNRLG